MKRSRVILLSIALLIFFAGVNVTLSNDITIVAINKETVEKIGPYPFSRDRYADFIESIYSYYSPKCVYFNLIISSHKQGSMESDRQLFDAVNAKRNLFFSSKVSDDQVEHEFYKKSQLGDITYNRIWRAQGALFPLEEIAKNGAYTSISDVRLDSRGIVEKMPTVILIDNKKYLSTPLFLSIAYLDIAPDDLFNSKSNSLGNSRIKTDRYGWFEIDFNHDFDIYSYHDILERKAPKALVDQRIVLLGLDIPAVESYLNIGKKERIPGVEVIANATQTLIDRLRN